MNEKRHEFSEYDFKDLIRQEKNVEVLQRLCALYQKSRGKRSQEIGEWLLMKPADVRKLVERFHEVGISCVREDPSDDDDDPSIPPEEFEAFKEMVVQAQEMQGDGRLGCRDIMTLAKDHFDVEYEESKIQKLLKKAGLGWIPGVTNTKEEE